MLVGEALRRYRGFAGLAQRQVADALGVSVTYISLLERERREPSLGHLKRHAQVLGVALSDIIELAELLASEKETP